MVACDMSVLVSAYYDGELPDAERRDVEAHLSSCPACAAELEQIRGLSRVLSTMSIPAAQAGFSSRLVDAFEHRPEITLFSFVRRLTATAAAVLVASMCYSVYAPHSSGPSQQVGLSAWERQVIEPDPAESPAGGESQLINFVTQDLKAGGRP